MKTEEEKIRKILQRGMEEPSSGFSGRVMLQIAEMQKAPQVQPLKLQLRPWLFAFVLLSLITLFFSALEGNVFLDFQQEISSILSIEQMTNSIFSLLGFWTWMLLSPWIKKRMLMSR